MTTTTPAPRTERRPFRAVRRLPLGGALLLALLCAALPAELRAVSVSPHALYIDHRTRTASLTLFNPGTQAEDIEIGFAFGYPQSDQAGQVTVPLVEVAPEGEPSAVPWLRAFPRRLRLEPGQRQVVRVMVQPPADLPDGEYWARVLVTSRGGQPPIEQVQENLSMTIAMESVIVTAVTYRKGSLSTGVAVTAGEARVTGAGAEAVLDLERQGTAAFLGRLLLEVVAPDGSVLARTEEGVAVYRALRRRVLLPVPATVPPGSVLRYRLDTERTDLPDGAALPAGAVSGSLPLMPG